MQIEVTGGKGGDGTILSIGTAKGSSSLVVRK